VSHDEMKHAVSMMRSTKAFLCKQWHKGRQSFELEAIELTTAVVHVCEGLEGGFISFDQRALMLSTIVRLMDEWEKFISFIAS
jgi:hypothetical protein